MVGKAAAVELVSPAFMPRAATTNPPVRFSPKVASLDVPCQPASRVQMTVDVKEWLAAWAEEHLHPSPFLDDGAPMTAELAMCLAYAWHEGIPRRDLEFAAGGDLRRYLLERSKATR